MSNFFVGILLGFVACFVLLTNLVASGSVQMDAPYLYCGPKPLPAPPHEHHNHEPGQEAGKEGE